MMLRCSLLALCRARAVAVHAALPVFTLHHCSCRLDTGCVPTGRQQTHLSLMIPLWYWLRISSLDSGPRRSPHWLAPPLGAAPACPPHRGAGGGAAAGS